MNEDNYMECNTVEVGAPAELRRANDNLRVRMTNENKRYLGDKTDSEVRHMAGRAATEQINRERGV